LGLKYNLIRDEFKNLPERIINRDVREIMITTGGSDPFNLTLRLANAILPEEEFKDVRINIVVGSGFTNADKLRELSERNPNVVLHENVLRMSEVMLKSDVAISAGEAHCMSFAPAGHLPWLLLLLITKGKWWICCLPKVT